MEHTEAAHISVDRYFGILNAAGSYPESGVKKLLLYSFLVDTVLDDELSEYLDDDGLLLIYRMLACLGNDPCLTVVQNRRIRTSRPRGVTGRLRISEAGKTRSTEAEELRTPEPD